MTPKPPKVIEPKDPIEAEAPPMEEERSAPRGRESLVSAGSLKKKPFTIKASLLGE